MRVVVFVVALCIVVVGAIACLGWYARSAYFVTLSKGRITIFQGRPGGVLWFQPTLVQRTTYGPSAVLAYNLQPLTAGVVEPSLAEARSYMEQKLIEKESEAVTPPAARGAPRPKHHKHKTSPTSLPRTSSPTTTAPARTTTSRALKHKAGKKAPSCRGTMRPAQWQRPARRRTELGMIILVLVLTGGLYTLSSFGREGPSPPGSSRSWSWCCR